VPDKSGERGRSRRNPQGSAQAEELTIVDQLTRSFAPSTYSYDRHTQIDNPKRKRLSAPAFNN